MLHYGMQHAAVHEPVNAGGGGQDGSLSQLDAPDEHDYAHWLQLSSPQTPVQPQVQGDQQSFVQDAYSAQQAAYYSSQQAQQPPATPVQVDQVYDGQSGFGYYIYDEQHQVQPPQQPQEPNGGAQYAYYNDAGDEHEAQPDQQQQHILDSPPSSAYPSQDAYALFATQFSTPEPQIQMAMYSSSPIERQPQQVPPPQPPSRLHPRVYPPSSNPLRPSRLRQVSNYEDDIQDMPAVSDQAAVSFDDRLAASSVLVPQPSESLAFALASPIKMSTDSSSSLLQHDSTSPVQARADPGPFNDTPAAAGPDNMSLLQSDSLYAALFSSADVAPIVTTRDEVPVDVEPSWTAESELLGAPAVHSAPALPTFSRDSALAGAVMDEFEFREVDVPQVVLVNADETDADADADAEGETDSGSPLPPLDLSGSNSISSNALTSSTLADEDWFTSPQAEHLKLVEQPKQEDELAMMLGDVIVESALDTPAVPSDAASDQAAALTAALSSFLDSAAAASASDTLSTTPPPSVERPKDELDPAAALLALAGPAPRTPQNTLPPSAPSSVSVPLITVVAPKRGGPGGKRKRGSATSSPARSRLSSPMPSPLSTPTHPRRRFFPQSPIAFHLGPTDDSDPRHRMRHGTRGNKLVGIDAEHQLDDKDKDHDLFVIRGGVFDHVPNGARIKVAAQRTGSRARGSENAGLRSATTSRAGSATGTSPAPGAFLHLRSGSLRLTDLTFI
ncbi:hypothetical protein EXIGLDRAFT_306386 [Exidia glandulosa HHB12029]|uniref:Uncharacterized protein n=1 Tax=Exidia glandulosa HHB12029 TaxID=1314781 RepID=A0A165D3F1_EXIGL|nr:hypothetical protein EXIGLDRAFT_306386 [Exidia glandulosa HHB12029]